LWEDLIALCRGDPEILCGWLEKDKSHKIFSCLFWMLIGSSIYGTTIGIWRSPLQAVYVALKFPLLIVLVTTGNALINGMLAQLYGAKISFRQSYLSVLMSFTTLSIIFLSLSPVSYFLIYSSDPMGSEGAVTAHSIIILFNVFVISFSGIASNVNLFLLIRRLTDSAQKSKQIISSWLAVNLLLGGQLSWMLRPFFGTPKVPVQFIRDDALDGNFFEKVLELVTELMK
jgi:hypothetical protein